MHKQTRNRNLIYAICATLVVVSAGVLSAKNKSTPLPPPHVAPPTLAKPTVSSKRSIQVALLLDTSSSMDGLIRQAQSQLWRIVHQLSQARSGGLAPTLKIALYQYGHNSLPAESGFIEQVLPFVTDLDLVSEKLFSLTTSGGDEYCGQAIATALNDLKWSSSDDTLKFIFIAGNEPFDQGPVSYRAAMNQARGQGITINPIHCGDTDPSWTEAAKLAGVDAISINHNTVAVHIAAPQDDEINRLSMQMNQTYVPYGAHGAAGSVRQQDQDANAAKSGAASTLWRSLAKNSVSYGNAHWDLVDAYTDGTIDLAKLKDEEFPAELRGKSAAEKRSYIQAKQSERKQIAKRITALNIARNAYIATQQKQASEQTLDEALLKAIRKKASRAGFKLKVGE